MSITSLAGLVAKRLCSSSDCWPWNRQSTAIDFFSTSTGARIYVNDTDKHLDFGFGQHCERILNGQKIFARHLILIGQQQSLTRSELERLARGIQQFCQGSTTNLVCEIQGVHFLFFCNHKLTTPQALIGCGEINAYIWDLQMLICNAIKRAFPTTQSLPTSITTQLGES